MGIYKCSCEFYVTAEDKQEAEQKLKEERVDNDFVESHILLDEVDEIPENEELWADYTEELEENKYSLCVACQNSFKRDELNEGGLCEGCELQDRE